MQQDAKVNPEATSYHSQVISKFWPNRVYSLIGLVSCQHSCFNIR